MPSRAWQLTEVETATAPAPPARSSSCERLAVQLGNAGTARTLARAPGPAPKRFAPAVPQLSRDFFTDAMQAGQQVLSSIGSAIDDAMNPEYVALKKKYGDEAAWPAPVEEYQTPFDNAPQSTAGERVIMNGEYLVVPDGVDHAHELVYSSDNGTFDSASGAKAKTFRTGTGKGRIDTGNVSFFLPAAFKRGDTCQVKAEIKIRKTGRVVHTRTWNYTAREVAPKTITQKESDAPRAIGSTYEYLLGPALPTGTRPFYEHQTVLEEFQSRTSNLQPADMKMWWRLTNGVFTKPALDAKLFAGSSSNGTFTANAEDKMHDVHGGGQSMLDEAAKHLEAPKDVHVDLPQTYTAGPGNVLGKYVVRRTRKTDGSYELRKWAS